MTAEDRLPWRDRVSLRVRITVITAVAVGVVVALGGILILTALRLELVRAADDAVKVRATEVAQLAAEGTLPQHLPLARDPETFAEVVADGRMVSATRGLGERNLFELAELEVGEADVVEVLTLPLDEPGPFRVVAQGVSTPDGPVTVFVAVSVEHLEHTIRTAVRTVAVALSLLVLVLATVTWIAIGHALAPVAAMRAWAASITGSNLESRAPVPDQQHDEIGDLARTVDDMLARLQNSAERQRHFVADAAHELRTPLASLRAQLETARDSGRTEGRERDMLRATGRMESLVDQLLILARADGDAPWVRRSVVDLDDIVDSAVRSLPTDPGVVIDTRAVRPVQLRGDADLLERVVVNLVDNARAHAHRAVGISLCSEKGVAQLTVDDDGTGVPEERRAEVFGRFVRLDASRDRRHGGVGLGLAIVAEIVHAHGGRVRVGDSPMGGARFTVELPTAPVEDSVDPPLEHPSSPTT
jgi:signal transduction histidine kinase